MNAATKQEKSSFSTSPPHDWEALTLGELERRGDVRLFRGRVISHKDIDRFPGDYPIYSSSVHANGLLGRYGRYMFDEELITWSVDGGGHFFYRPKHRFSVTNVCGYLRIRTPSINYHYLAYHLQHLHSRKVFDYTLKAHPSVIRGAYALALPPPPEQRAIAEALSDVDGLLGALEALIAKKRAIKQAAMQQLLTGKTRLPGFPGPWETKRLGDIAELHRENVVPAAIGDELFTHFSLPAFDDGQIPVTEPGSAIGSNKFRVPECAVLVSKLNPRISRVWMPHGLVQNAVASTEFLVFTPRQGTSRLFLFVLCSSPEFCRRLELSATGTTGSHQRVTPSDAMKINLRVPPEADEQIAIATVLSDMDAEIVALERRRDKTRAIKQGMMQQLLTGRIRLVEPTRGAHIPEAKVRKTHDSPFREAVVISMLTKEFGSDQYPLGRKRYTKLSYLLHRHAQENTEGYLKKAAGPYNPKTRYGGPEGIALKKGYIRKHKCGHYQGFISYDNVVEAEGYFKKWYGTACLSWLEQFRRKTNDELEVLATVDMAAQELRGNGRAVTPEAVKGLIQRHPEWEAKLNRPAFADANIVEAIATSSELFGEVCGS